MAIPIENNPIKKPIIIFTIILYTLNWIILAVSPAYRPQWLLENYLVFLVWGLLIFSFYKFRLSTASYILIFIYLTFHSFGAHYGYNDVPFGYWASHYFNFARPNIYDRIVHFLFGFLLTYPIFEILKRYSSLSKIWLLILPSEFILSYSAVYELIEAITAWVLPQSEYDGFIGLQGDIWDGYRDMLCAFSGSLIISFGNIAVYIFRRKKNN
jgi:putative membrane protein